MSCDWSLALPLILLGQRDIDSALLGWLLACQLLLSAKPQDGLTLQRYPSLLLCQPLPARVPFSPTCFICSLGEICKGERPLERCQPQQLEDETRGVRTMLLLFLYSVEEYSCLGVLGSVEDRPKACGSLRFSTLTPPYSQAG